MAKKQRPKRTKTNCRQSREYHKQFFLPILLATSFAHTTTINTVMLSVPAYLRASQVFMVIGTISGVIGTILAVVVLCGRRKKNVHTAMGVSFASGCK